MQKRGISELVRKIESESSRDLNRGRGRPQTTSRTGVDKDINELE